MKILLCQHPKALPLANTDARQLLNYKIMKKFNNDLEFYYLDTNFSYYQQLTKFQLLRIKNKINKILNLDILNDFLNSTYISEEELEKVKPDIIVSYGIYPILPDKYKDKIPIFHTAGFMTDTFIKRKYKVTNVLKQRKNQINSEMEKIRKITNYHSHTKSSTEIGKINFEIYKNKFVTIPFFLPNIISITPDSIIKKWESETLEFLFVGNQAKRKGLDILVNSWSKIYSKELNIRLTIISNFQDGLINIPNGENISLKSNISNNEVLEEMKKSHFLILPSYYESYGLVLIEAMASACILITTDAEVQKEIVNTNIGFTFNPDSENDLTELLKRIIEDKKNLKDMSYNSIQEYKKTYDKEVVVSKYSEAWTKIIKNKNER